jgi:hypothetical protein
MTEQELTIPISRLSGAFDPWSNGGRNTNCISGSQELQDWCSVSVSRAIEPVPTAEYLDLGAGI